MSQQDVETMRAAYAAFNRADIPAVLACSGRFAYPPALRGAPIRVVEGSIGYCGEVVDFRVC